MKVRAHMVGLVLGLVGVAFNLGYLRYFEEEASGGQRVSLLVTAKPVVRGNKITAEMLAVRDVPQAYVDERAIRAEDRDKIIGIKATNNLAVSQIVQWTDTIAPSDTQRDLSTLVQPGHRGLPLHIDHSDSLPLIRPGDFVDVIAVINGESQTLLQRVLVLATGLEMNSDRNVDPKASRGVSTITVSVGSADGQLLVLAQSKGKLTVLVRNPDDQRVSDAIQPTSEASLLDVTKRVQAVQHRPATIVPRAPVRLEDEK